MSSEPTTFQNDPDEEPILTVSRRPRFFITEPTDPPITPWDKNIRRWKNRPKDHPMNKESMFTLYEGWRKLGIREDLEQRKVLEKQWQYLRDQDSQFQKELRNITKHKTVFSTFLPHPGNNTLDKD